MSREKNVWFAEEILLDAKLINLQIEAGEWDKVEELLKAEAVLSRDTETGRYRPKKASEYTLRLIAEVLRIMKLDIQQRTYNISTLAVAEQCLRLIRSCAASGMKLQTYISKDLSILDDMLTIFNEYQHLNEEMADKDLLRKFESCMVALTQTLGNLVVNNPFNQTIIWEKFGSYIINALLGHNEKIASCAAMIVYNILLGQPNVLPDDVLLLNALAYMYSDGNSEFPHLIIEYLIGVENSYIEKLYNRLEPDTRLLILNLAYNILMSMETQDVNVSVNFIKFIAHEFKMKSDCILKTVDKYVTSIEPQEVVFLLDIIATASSMDVYMECLQSDPSLFINISFLLRSIHDLGKQDNNFFSSIQKLYGSTGRAPPEPVIPKGTTEGEGDKIDGAEETGVKKCDSTDMLQGTEPVSECTESENSEQYFECNDQPACLDKLDVKPLGNIEDQLTFIENKTNEIQSSISPVVIPESVCGLNYPRQSSLDRKISDAKIDENLIKMAFSKNINPDANAKIPEHTTTLQYPAVDNIMKNELGLNKKMSLDEMEPPLIIDSPDVSVETVVPKERTPSVSRDGSVESSQVERKNSTTIPSVLYNPKVSSNPQTPFNISRQQSVEPGIEASETVIREMTTELAGDGSQNIIQDLQLQKVKTSQGIAVTGVVEQSPINPNNIEVETPANTVVVQPKLASEPIPVKKSQNVSAEFDLSEQLQKILGISADKANLRAENSEPKETHSVHIGHLKVDMSSQQPLSQSANVPLIQNSPNPEAIHKPKAQIRVPNVKIESPENNLKSKLGNFDNTGPKKLNSVVETVEQHVAFGFKATLIRTLGNLCWKNQFNKRQIRELDIIPYLLDCCNIDARNPLIMQWVILAVRNFCENCPENQSVISALTVKEPLDNELLMEMGLTLHTDAENNSIRIVPLKKK